jgi:hypothetical protein
MISTSSRKLGQINSDDGAVGLQIHPAAAAPQLLAKVLGVLAGHAHNDGLAERARLQGRQARGRGRE